MKPYVKTAVWAAVITVISPVVPYLQLLSFPGFMLAFIFELGPSTENIPTPGNIAVHLLNFAVWWGILYFAHARWRRRRAMSRWLNSPLP